MEQLLKEDVDIVYVSQGDIPPRRGCVIAMNTEFLHQLGNSKEMKTAIAKRFHGKPTKHIYPPFPSLVHWVLSSDEYKVREANILSVSDDDITEVWDNLQTP